MGTASARNRCGRWSRPAGASASATSRSTPSPPRTGAARRARSTGSWRSSAATWTELGKMMKHQIRLLAVGSLRRLPPTVRGALRATIAATRRNTGMTVILAVSYGGREEIARAARAIARRVRRGELSPERITAGTLARHLGTRGIPDPDLLIRTSGEMRLSNFFLWQLAYTEMYVTDTLWPDFRERDFLQALASFQQRQRRFGRTAAQVEREKLRAAN